ncbi:MAG: hypothetical protein ACJAZ2_001321 [Glaciecola sp.]
MDLPGIKKNIVFSLFFILTPALVSGAIYLLFRTSDTVIYQIYEVVFGSNSIDHLRETVQNTLITIPSWFIYSFPGGLWVFAFANFCFLFLNDKTKAYYKGTLLTLFGIVTSLELLQLLHYTDGRFDFLDIACYLIATITSAFIGVARIQKIKYQPIFKNDKKPFFALSITVCLFCAGIYLADVLS